MTDQLTDDEKAYYEGKLDTARQIVVTLGWSLHDKEQTYVKLQPLIVAVFEKIASPLHFLRQAPTQADVNLAKQMLKQEKPAVIELGETTFKDAKSPNKLGMDQYTYASNVKADLKPVLQYLRVQGNELKSHGGYVYALSYFNNRDYLWRKTSKEAAK